jgi:hypothetical protein
LTPSVSALLIDEGQTRPKLLHTLTNQASVRFELSLARATQANSTLLPLKVGPAANEAGREVIKLRKFDL